MPASRRCIVIGVVVIVIVVALGLAVGLYFGLTADDDNRSSQLGPQEHVPLKIMYVRSGGLVGDTSRITVVYQALPNHYTNWRLMQMSDDPLRSTGRRRQVMMDGERAYECSEDVSVRSLRRLIMIITSGIEFISMAINVTTATSAWTYNTQDHIRPFIDFNASVEAPASGDVSIYATLRTANAITYRNSPADALFITLNTTVDPPTVFETNSFGNSIMVSPISSKVSPSNSSYNITDVMFTLKQDIVQFGGQFNLMVRDVTDRTYIEQLKHAVWIDVSRTGSDEVVPQGISGLKTFRSRIRPFFGDVYTLTCFAMGNPSPGVEILREVNGNSKKVDSETNYKDRWSTSEIYTIHDKTAESGNYTCRTKSGSSTTTTVELYAAEKTEFVKSETGILKRAANQIVVQCKATGVPAPILTFRQVDPDEFQVNHLADWYFGVNMIDSGRYKYYRNVTETSATLTMTISPVNVTIKMVSCDARAIPGYSWTISTSIDLRAESKDIISASSHH